MEYLLPLLFFFVALIYSSIGLGGGSSYIALMTIVGVGLLGKIGGNIIKKILKN